MSVRRAIVLSASLICFIFCAQPAPAQKSRPTFDKIKAKAEAGDADAEFQLGHIFVAPSSSSLPSEEIKGLQSSLPEALAWYEKAAEQGHVGAEAELGGLLHNGAGGDDPAVAWKGLSLLEKAAEHGNDYAEYLLGEILYTGALGYDLRRSKLFATIPRDRQEGRRWLERAAAQHQTFAEQELKRIDRGNSSLEETSVDDFLFPQQVKAAALITAAAIAPLLLLVCAYRKKIGAWWTKREATRLQKREATVRLRELRTEIEPLAQVRWPEHLFPRIPKHICDYEGTKPLSDWDDENWEFWKLMLERYPALPRSDADRQSRELEFWRERMFHLLAEGQGAKSLLPKQTIIDRWWGSERMMFKFYYAATGVHHPSVFSHRFLANMEIAYKERNRKKWDTGDATERSRLERYKQANREIDDFWDKEVPAHKERWGEWFFHNIQQAFQKEFGPADDTAVANQKAHGDARLATEEEALAAATGSVRRLSIHDQEF